MSRPSSSRVTQVHPRVCGEAKRDLIAFSPACGPSPRVRGSLRAGRRQRRRKGSIPACAGKPGAPECRCRSGRVHPRVCGEASSCRAPVRGCRGPSPRVRGSRASAGAGGVRPGSIPACAGKPRSGPATPGVPRVHPRVCGEAAPAAGSPARARGPSPRVRGSPRASRPWMTRMGSIPACAGKPAAAATGLDLAKVHPRVCGEAAVALGLLANAEGPSPRVRGSLIAQGTLRRAARSIPACAGKPYAIDLADQIARGPSPRVRGSLESAEADVVRSGSIPACAGKPTPTRRCSGRSTVHPRVCGEAARRPDRGSRQGGPSPRVRGSPEGPQPPRRSRGSIPACAGKPRLGRCRPCGQRVHPRVCGEARVKSGEIQGAEGPSPRVRGSHPLGDRAHAPPGSIPACAGKPLSDY